MGRPRKKAFQKLPKYVYVNRGRFVFIDRIDGVQQKAVILGKTDMSIPEVWSSYENITVRTNNTLQYIVDKYTASREFDELKSKYHIQQAFNRILTSPVGSRTFGQIPFQSITTGTIRKYLDYRNNKSGNREVAYLSSAWSWCYERDIVTIHNPCKGVRRIKEESRKRYITDFEYKAIYDNSSKYLQVAMELAYLCRMRVSEALDTRFKDVEPDGLNTRRVKGSNDALTLWTPRLKSVVEMGLEGSLKVPDMPIVNNNKGSPVTYSALRSAWVRAIKKSGVKGCTFHDLKAKGVSDFEGDKKSASGHKTEAMVAIYDRKRKEVESTY